MSDCWAIIATIVAGFIGAAGSIAGVIAGIGVERFLEKKRRERVAFTDFASAIRGQIDHVASSWDDSIDWKTDGRYCDLISTLSSRAGYLKTEHQKEWEHINRAWVELSKSDGTPGKTGDFFIYTLDGEGLVMIQKSEILTRLQKLLYAVERI